MYDRNSEVARHKAQGKCEMGPINMLPLLPDIYSPSAVYACSQSIPLSPTRHHLAESCSSFRISHPVDYPSPYSKRFRRSSMLHCVSTYVSRMNDTVAYLAHVKPRFLAAFMHMLPSAFKRRERAFGCDDAPRSAAPSPSRTSSSASFACDYGACSTGLSRNASAKPASSSSTACF